MKVKFPDYNNCITNIPNSILKYFGYEEGRKTSSLLDSYLKKEYERFDAGSRELVDDTVLNKACRCAEVLTGKINSEECPLFGTACTTEHPQGACMVSMEGSCFNRLNERGIL